MTGERPILIVEANAARANDYVNNLGGSTEVVATPAEALTCLDKGVYEAVCINSVLHSPHRAKALLRAQT